ncbi:recombinase family protein [Streptomyces sp. CA-132043]|uniref:recombinase family protein n=1 Tax=Streptomyces sp. CA-132043 TaxID=3240048 RepID=UPI003D90E354
MTPHGETTPPVVLYVCAERAKGANGTATQYARTEGHAFAQERGLKIAEIVTDTYGEPDPVQRRGWRRVRQLVQTGDVTAVLVRWPSAIAPESAHELRHRETAWLRDRGVRVRYTWPPLSSNLPSRSDESLVISPGDAQTSNSPAR